MFRRFTQSIAFSAIMGPVIVWGSVMALLWAMGAVRVK